MNPHTHSKTTRDGSAQPEPPTPPSPMALRPRDAAQALGISERLLWGLTAPRGPIPAIRCGRVVLYRLQDLDAWLAGMVQRVEQEGSTQ